MPAGRDQLSPPPPALLPPVSAALPEATRQGGLDQAILGGQPPATRELGAEKRQGKEANGVSHAMFWGQHSKQQQEGPGGGGVFLAHSRDSGGSPGWALRKQMDTL